MATSLGAEVRPNEPMQGFDEIEGGVRVQTAHGMLHASALVIAVGAWTADIVRDLALPLVVQRNVQFWFEPARSARQFTPDAFPIFISEYAPGLAWYGFPDLGDGLKVAFHHHGPPTHPDSLARDVSPDDVERMRRVMREFMPEADGALRGSAACMYTNTPDEHFIIGRHPASHRVVLASPCSGHGFKFASAIGELLADLATDARPNFDLSLFSPERFASRS
jgi:sarcosine oxidase